VDEFIATKMHFPESHAASIAEIPSGLVVAWFGGTKERNPDVEIWVSRKQELLLGAPLFQLPMESSMIHCDMLVGILSYIKYLEEIFCCFIKLDLVHQHGKDG